MRLQVDVSPKTRQKIVRRSRQSQRSLEDREVFAPNPGGQTELFNLISLTEDSELDCRWVYFRGGINAGKSWAGAAFSVSRTKIDPQALGLITANSYGQLKTSTCVSLAKFCAKYGYRLTVGQRGELVSENPNMAAKKIVENQGCFIDGVFILVLTSDVFAGKTSSSKEPGRGLEIRWCWYDEAAYGTQNIFDTINGRLGRGEGFLKGLGLLTSSINKNHPYNYLYDYLDDPQRKPSLHKLHKTIVATSKENLFRDADFVESLEATYTDELIAIELEAIYATINTGKIYSYFKRSRHAIGDLEIARHLPIHISIDFNHHPSCAIAAQYDPDVDEIYVIKEWFIENSNTFELADTIARWFMEVRGERPQNNWGWGAGWESYSLKVHGDASGNQKTANSRHTNWQIVGQYLYNYGIEWQRKYKKANPNVDDTINSVNCALKGDKLFFSSELRELFKDLEQLQRNDKGEIDKKADPMRSHLSDCLRYLIWDLMPYTRYRHDSVLVDYDTRPQGILV